MYTWLEFIETKEGFIVGSLLLLVFASHVAPKIKSLGLPLYTFLKELLAGAAGTLKQIATPGIKKIEPTRSEKGYSRRHPVLNICSLKQEEYASGPLKACGITWNT